ncbi:MAG TPA: hypothetical protein PKC25_01310, partial [Candidatus Rifleibacterium sp.]|nr:hypothetical protein [Candidatus Rifleibacterium sp.]
KPYMITSLHTPVATAQVGSGSAVTMIQQFRDEFIDAKITKETSTLEWKTAADDLMKQIEAIVNEPGTATIRDELDKYWAAWRILPTTLLTVRCAAIWLNRLNRWLAFFLI